MNKNRGCVLMSGLVWMRIFFKWRLKSGVFSHMTTTYREYPIAACVVSLFRRKQSNWTEDRRSVSTNSSIIGAILAAYSLRKCPMFSLGWNNPALDPSQSSGESTWIQFSSKKIIECHWCRLQYRWNSWVMREICGTSLSWSNRADYWRSAAICK